MPTTWNGWSKKALGYVATPTPITERYVALYKIQTHIDQGHDNGAIARIWNQGNAGPCVIGVNSKGVPYNSCSYEKRILALLR